MADVYISCDPRDAATAHHLQNVLQSRSISCCVSGGDIIHARVFVVLVSRHSISSSIVKGELYRATEANLPIFPVRLDNSPLNDTFQFFLGARQWINAKWRLSSASRELCNAICVALHLTPPELVRNDRDKAKDHNKEDKKQIFRMLLCILIVLGYLIATSISFALLRKENLGLHWKIEMISSLVMIVTLFLTMAPLWGGYKTALRTVLEKLRDAFRGE